MPAKNPRINVVLDAPLYNQVQFLAGKDGVSLSTKVRDLLKEALELKEIKPVTVFQLLPLPCAIDGVTSGADLCASGAFHRGLISA